MCQEQLIEAGKLVAKSAESCVEASKATTSDDQLLKQVGVATTTVNQALNDLLQHIKQHATGGQPIGCYDQATDTILSVTENIWVMQVRVSSWWHLGKSIVGRGLEGAQVDGAASLGSMPVCCAFAVVLCLRVAPRTGGWYGGVGRYQGAPGTC